jgi:replication factor A1
MQGKAIYSEIPQSEVERLGPQLEIDNVYTIRKFYVRISKAKYVPFDAELMLQLTSFTTITPSKISVTMFPKFIYNITPLNEITTTGEAASRYIGLCLSLCATIFIHKHYNKCALTFLI